MRNSHAWLRQGLGRRLAQWGMALAVVVAWSVSAPAAPALDTETLLSRPTWALGGEMVSRPEFALLIEKIVRSRKASPVHLSGSEPWISRGQAVNDLVRAFGF